MTKEEVLREIISKECWYKEFGISRQNACNIKRLLKGGKWQPVHEKILEKAGYEQKWCKKHTENQPENQQKIKFFVKNS